MKQYNETVAVVTGAASGIGKTLAGILSIFLVYLVCWPAVT